ncbi:hypothetical protein CASFOL_027166 [Castilleja foliolosa]|uniref:Uncharacterized protein n=1 Tax=Castilleja foliolosa TaxID=1961234 RepID=A0ABD3CH64_9LAMI
MRALVLYCEWSFLHDSFLLAPEYFKLKISGTIISASILIEDDKVVGKFSPLVRLGSENGSKVVKMSVLGLYWLVLGLGNAQTLPFSCVVLCAMTLPMGNLVVSFVEKNHKCFEALRQEDVCRVEGYGIKLYRERNSAEADGLDDSDVSEKRDVRRTSRLTWM